MDALTFLQSVSGYAQSQNTGSADKPIRIAVIDPTFDPFVNFPAVPPLPKVTFDGESTLSVKQYPYVQGYIPVPSQRVWLVPVGTTYLICGAVQNTALQGFYAFPLTGLYGVDIGGGMYIENDGGALQLNGYSVHPNSNGVCGQANSVLETSVTGTYANLGGLNAAVAFTKRETGTKLRVNMEQSWYSNNINTSGRYGVRIGATDYDVIHAAGGWETAGPRNMSCGTVHIPGISAGSFTVQGRWARAAGGTGTLSRDANDWSCLSVMEVSS